MTARYKNWDSVPFAPAPASAPAWPLPTTTPKFATWSFAGGRPFACAAATCERWHAGIDLTKAKDGALVVAPEDATIVGVDRGWSEGSKAVFLVTASGLFVVLGGFKAKSHLEFGVQTLSSVAKGQSLGRVLCSYGMIHLETYLLRAPGALSDRTANSVWWVKDPPPAGLLNPTKYVESMVPARPDVPGAPETPDAPEPESAQPARSWFLPAAVVAAAATAVAVTVVVVTRGRQ